MRARALTAGIALAACAACFLWGRASTPAKVVEKTKTVTVARELTAEELAGLVRTRVVAQVGPTRVVRQVQRVVVAGECREVVNEETTTGPAVTTTDVASETREKRVSERVSLSTRESVRVVEARPRFGVGVVGGLSLDGSKHWGAYGRIRVLGPLELGAIVDAPARTGLVTLGVTW